MKKKTGLLIGVLCAVSIFVGAAGAELIREITAELRPDFTIKIDGTEREFKNVSGERVYPILYEGTTYLPIRAIGEIMGKTVYWYEDDKRIELKEVQTTVTDADVIITGDADNKNKDKDKVKEDKVKKDKPAKEAIDTTGFIGEEKAKKIALEKAGLTTSDVIFDRVELDRDDRVVRYEVEFRQGRVEYDAEIKADDGTILSWEKDLDD